MTYSVTLFAILALLVICAINDIMECVFPNSKGPEIVRGVVFVGILFIMPTIMEFLFMLVDINAIIEFISDMIRSYGY